jgi:CBS-domain-containing membrane protein
MQSKTLPHSDVVYLIGSFAPLVLIYGVIQSPLAQPRNLGGHVISAIVGDCSYICSRYHVVNSVLIRFNFYCFNAIDKTPSPGGATALIAVTGSEEIKNMGYWYVITPVLSGVLIL